MAVRKIRTPDSTSGHFTAVTPHDSNAISETRALYVGGAGDVAVENDQGAAVTFTSVPAGTVLPIRTRKVRATDTTATDIVALL